jgi:hypothetical protein
MQGSFVSRSSCTTMQREAKALTIFIVVTHLGFLLVDGETARFNGLLSDLDGLLAGWTDELTVDSGLLDVDGFAVGGTRRNTVNSDVDFLLVAWLETLSVLTFNYVNWVSVMRVLVVVNLNVSVVIFGMRSRRGKKKVR